MRHSASSFSRPIYAPIILALAIALLAACSRQASDSSETLAVGELPEIIDFNQHIRPIFTGNCTACHGGVKKTAGVSFIYREDALGQSEFGKDIVVAQHPEQSELFRRITAEDEKERMPPADHGDRLSSREIALVEKWIEQGAPWSEHWAYIKPEAQPLPAVANSAWANNGIDRFILAKLEANELSPEPEEKKSRLLRRLSLDLTGLPPTTEERDAFIASSSPDTYERAVDRLLESPHFGERWATLWLDLARYADTQGYEKDSKRDIWAYRDWVIQAFNKDLPFDQFTIKQIAGDLLPDPQYDDWIATAFHRNSKTNIEGGTDDEEYRLASAMDRVNTTWQAWMGTTFACVQCHDHPYDPFPHKSYYQFLDFFNHTVDHDTADDFPRFPVTANPDDAVRLYALQVQSKAAEEAYLRPFQKLSVASSWHPLQYRKATSNQGVTLSVENDADGIPLLKTGPDAPRGTIHAIVAQSDLDSLSSLRIDALMLPGNDVSNPGDPFILSHIEAVLLAPDGQETPIELSRVIADEAHQRLWPELSLDPKNKGGWGAYPKQHYPRWAVFIPKQARNLPKGAALKITLHHLQSHGGAQQPVLRRFRISINDDPEWTRLANSPATKAALRNRESLLAERDALKTSDVPILRERSETFKRITHVFDRGDWQSKAEIVEAATPALMNGLEDESNPDRLQLANWLASPDNPLTARVTVNRFWEQLFGIGIVDTLEDFGSPGSPPSHPELLDYLALRFQNELDWSMKGLLKELVTSSAYRQSARATAAKTAIDPNNRLLSHGPRNRLTSEMTRDNALLVSGILSRKQFGPPVMPEQPEGIWRAVYNNTSWKTSKGEDRYRRAVYTFWKRTAPYPSFITFDAPSREVCTPRRITTNTPLQALVTLNDPVYWECASKLASFAMDGQSNAPEIWIQRAFDKALLRSPNAAELSSLLSLYRDTLATSPNESAAITLVASAIMNLDEFLTK